MNRPLIRDSVAGLSPYVPGEQPVDPDLIKLNTNENPYPPAPEVLEVLEGVGADALRRYPDPACTALRNDLAALHGCDPSQVFVGNGSDEVLSLCLRAFVHPGKSVGFFDPSYSLYPVLAGIADVPARPIELGPDFGWTMPHDYDVGLFFLTTPNAPTSLLFSRKDIEAYLARSTGVLLIDEAYVDFAREDCVDLALSNDRVLVSRSFSKSYSLAGLRLGYSIGPTPLIEALFKVKDSYNVGRLAQDAGRTAVRAASHMRANVDKIKATRTRVTEILRERGINVFDSETNFLWIHAHETDARPVFEALRARKILVRHFPGRLTRAYLRVTVGTDAEMDRFLEAMDS